ncbi:MAG: TlpA family protein disulfide reductase [Thermoflexales bacterium]|nr:TlpA family protein disulfide reductase [Thermoflexales bacterium]
MSVATKTRSLVLSLLTIISIAFAARPGEAQSPAADFQSVDLQGRAVQLSNLKGCGVVLYFFASWCPYCERQTPAIVSAHKQLRKRGVVFIGVNLYDDSEEAVREFMARHGISFSTIMDREAAIANLYRVEGVPQTVLISPQGTVSREIYGWSPQTNLARLGRSIAGGRNCKVSLEQLP